MPRKLIALLIAVVFATVICMAQSAKKEAPPNTLTKEEKAAGWRLLFDGKTLAGWRGFHRDKVPEERWVVEDGSIKKLPAEGELGQAGGDLITVDQFENFEFQLEWKITKGGNSGIKYLVTEDLPKTGHSAVSFEMQILDDDNHPDAKMGRNGNRTASSLYDLIPPAKNKILRPVGEFNQIRLVKKGNHVEHWLNGVKVVEFELGSPELKALIAESKYKNIAGFGEARKGHILLQDHGDSVWFRNIKIRELK
ncbi:MAG TPA: DUF1080 domain-containing protein [Blastocatellia bacterium]|nr:DUF1080 domain-containing protein [Blastocatellia bacterium]